MSIFGERLRDTRERQKLSRKKLIERAYKNQLDGMEDTELTRSSFIEAKEQAIKRYENGETMPQNPSDIFALAKALECNPAYLSGAEDINDLYFLCDRDRDGEEKRVAMTDCYITPDRVLHCTYEITVSPEEITPGVIALNGKSFHIHRTAGGKFTVRETA